MAEHVRNRVDGVLLIDGLTSVSDPSAHLILDEAAASVGATVEWAKYLPFSSDGIVVETTSVFPALFGLHPSANPGRSGLEQLLDGDLHSDCEHFAAIDTATGDSLVSSIVTGTGCHARVSKYSGRRTWLLCSQSRVTLDDAVAALRERCSDLRVSHLRSPQPGWRSTLGRQSDIAPAAFELIGWCEGALLSALLRCGIVYRGEYGKLPNPPDTRDERANSLDSLLDNVATSGRRPIVYLKDPAWDARFSQDKNAAIIFSARILQALIVRSLRSTILVVSDHNSEPGRDETLVGKTCVGLFSRDLAQIHRWRHDMAMEGPYSLQRSGHWTQDSLFSYLSMAWL